MRSRTTALVAFLLCISAMGQKKSCPEPYDLQEAYQVYSVLVPREESYGFAKGTLVIQLETEPEGGSTRGCLSDEAADKFMAAVSDYTAVNGKRWLLQRQFQVDKPYEFVSSHTINAYFKEQGTQGWNIFYKQHPGSGGFIRFSAVGFNKTKTQAVGSGGSSCGALCASWTFHLLEKVDGKWKESSGVTCFAAS